ncbi:hypothetical protein [uncultured Thiocystis sp.]|jgi:archaellum component FlaC|uniref:hypothetical protein n=1 Tax=uncultured Thiocystis sp. TaxID=1202134 RepID=UPI0025E0838D|nr:hypothetical protein [uncultured Thiocystis sp.]
MTVAAVERRVDTLEYYMKELSYQSMRTEMELARLSQEMRDFKDEMRVFKGEMGDFKDEMGAFKDEMGAFKDEMGAFKDEMKDFKDEMKDFKDEMRDFKDEMREFKDEARQQSREMNRKWGDLSNKLGTLVEDLVAPSLPRIVQDALGLDVLDLSIRRKRKLSDGRVREFDAIAVASGLVCLNSTKSTLRSAAVDDFIEEIELFRVFFPEYRETPVVGILASLRVDESVLNHAIKTGFLVLATGDQLMEVMNPPGFVPKRW